MNDDPAMGAEWQVCAVCGYPLERTPDGWTHVREVDHLPVPVDGSTIQPNQRCDFCDSEPVTDVVLARDFDMPLLPGAPSQRSVGPWAACAGCAELIRRDRWGQLVTRVKQVGGVGGRNASRALLVDLYDRVQRAMYGVESVEDWRARGAYRTED